MSGLFELDGVVAQRGGRTVLDGLDLEIDSGATAIVGPSGVGKSTLLRLLNRLADPVAGTIRFEGCELGALDPLELRRRVCLVAQLPALLEGTVAENVRYGPALCGREADVPGSLERAGLGADYAPRDAGRLSVGEQQRVMLARALALEPRVLLLDEPTAALDEHSRDAVEATVCACAADGVATVFVTHDLAQAERVAQRTFELGSGGHLA